jgi:cell wall-associated NlpC family hydrolase
MSALDTRLHAYRADLADSRLKGIIEAKHYADSELRRVSAPIAAVRREPRPDAMQITQVLLGEECRVFEIHKGWAWVQLTTDGYVGYIGENALSLSSDELTHRVAVPSTFIYPAANVKAQPVTAIPMNSRIAVTGVDGKFAKLKDGGFIIASHIKPLSLRESDFVAVAQQFLNVPYLWGGKSFAGLDCSGLVQLSLEASGIACPRDTDMQQEALGSQLRINDLDGLTRGDLVFWDGHVGVMTGSRHLLHANGHHMLVAHEPLEEAVARIKASHGEITAINRL